MSSSTTPSIVGRALLVSNDAIAVGQVVGGMRKFAIEPEACTYVAEAERLIYSRKYEAVLIDLAMGENVGGLLEKVRLSPSNQKAVTFVIGDPQYYAGPPLRPNFVMRKPLNDTVLESTLRAALGSIIQEYRRYFRYVIASPIRIRISNERTLACEMINISEGGLAIRTTVALPVGNTVRAQFTLPGEVPFDIQAEICWRDKISRTGLQFLRVPPDQKSRLQNWLSRRIEESLPESTAQYFQKPK